MNDLAIIIVSTNEAHWLPPCLGSVFAHAGGASLDVVVADNSSSDGTRTVVEEEFPEARVVTCENKGFAHANNRALVTCGARYVLFLNPDTEILEGTFAELVDALDRRPTVGLAGVRQVTADGALYPTIRRFPNALRALGDALGERVSSRWSALGEREINLDAYDRETECDWTSGSFMFTRVEAIESAGFLDERFFIYSEEIDLCHRITNAGWEIRHLPFMTILHHASKGGENPRTRGQDAFARLQYARKNFSPAHRAAYRVALALRYSLRTALRGDGARRAAYRAALYQSLGLGDPPFGPPPRQAVRLHTDPEAAVGASDRAAAEG